MTADPQTPTAETIGEQIGWLVQRVAEVMREDGGGWRACSGCQESVDGCVSYKDYPYSTIFQCQPGAGCGECGGIGVLWEDGNFWSGYGDMSDDMDGHDMTEAIAGIERPTPAASSGQDLRSKAVSEVLKYIEDADGLWPQDATNIVNIVLANSSAPAVQPGGDLVGSAMSDIAAERQRQIESEGWTPEHDDEHTGGEMAGAAACYALHDVMYWNSRIDMPWPWDAEWRKPKDQRRNLVRSGALIVAEIERLDRAAATPQPEAEEGA